MNFERFITRRLLSESDYKGSISAPIIKIAITAIALGMIMMLIAVATGTGLQKKIHEKVAAFHGDIRITNYDTNFSNDSQTPLALSQSFYPNFHAVPEIIHIQPIAQKGAVFRTETQFEGVVVKGVDSTYNWQQIKTFIVAGRLPNFKAALNEEILISAYLANRLELQVGSVVTAWFFDPLSTRKIRTRNFEIVGLYTSAFREFDAQYVWADIRHIQKLNRWNANEVGAFELFVSPNADIDLVGEKVYQEIDSMLDAQTLRSRFYTIYEWLDLFDFNIILIIGIMIVVGSINMITALLVLILERTQMIGIFKALGSSNWQIRKIFMYNAAYLIGLGLLWGNGIGLGLLLLQKYFKILPLNPDTYYVTEAPVHIDFTHIIFLNIGTFVLCVIFLLLPSYLVSKIQPIKAIRFQ